MPHGRLQEWVAVERGHFRDEGLDYEFVPWTLGRREPEPAAAPEPSLVPGGPPPPSRGRPSRWWSSGGPAGWGPPRSCWGSGGARPPGRGTGGATPGPGRGPRGTSTPGPIDPATTSSTSCRRGCEAWWTCV